MQDDKIVVARVFDTYDGRLPSRAGVITRLDASKFKTICIYLVRESDKPNYFEKSGYEAFYLSNSKMTHSLSFIVILKLSRILKQGKADIVHCHRHKATSIGTIAGVLAGTPVIMAQVHGVARTRNIRRRMLNNLLFRRIDKIITVGEATREDVIKTNPGVEADKVWSEGNSIEFDQFANLSANSAKARERLGLPADGLVFGTVGRMAKNKGQKYLIAAFAEVKKALPQAHLVFVGSGELLGELQEQARQTGFGDSIHFPGYCDNVAEIYCGLDVFVLPSIGSEGMPRVMLEAMAAGVPCTGTDFSGIPEILDQGKYGPIVKPGDSVALAEAMLKVARMSAIERNELTSAAKQRVRLLFSHEIVAGRLGRLYEDEFAKSVGRISGQTSCDAGCDQHASLCSKK
jgi:glycosyltransferase involved in cell wall biosynthesis